MSHTSDQLKRVRKLVVFFDICSSTKILENLLQTGHEQAWRNLLIGLKKFVLSKQQQYQFETYKFLGDGWILLFDPEIDGDNFLGFLKQLCREYERLYYGRIDPVLEDGGIRPGLTFGADTGPLVTVIMNEQREYVGRALNLAARLQSAIGQRDDKPEGKLLISKSAHLKLGLRRMKFSGKLVHRNLRNISGGERYQAFKINISQ